MENKIGKTPQPFSHEQLENSLTKVLGNNAVTGKRIFIELKSLCF